MKRMPFSFLVLALSGAFYLGHAQERKLERKELPAAVERTVARESAGATVKGFSKEKENGVQTYEMELVVDGHSKDVAMNSNGDILEIEEEVSMDSLPDSVRKALTSAAGTGTIGKIESLTKKDKLVAYEAVVTSGKKRHEIQVGPNGEKLRKPE